MSAPGYIWRDLTPIQREELLVWRKDNARPWHAPPHRPNYGHLHFLISAACYEHAPHIGHSLQRMDSFSATLLELFREHTTRTVAWCVMPNHYHALVEAPNILKLLYELGRFHGRTSRAWNGEENTRGRQIFHGAVERFMRSERHFFATVNYVHNNPVHHGYARLWTEWQWSSATDYLEQMGRTEAERVWKEYPVRDYGKTWDDAGM
ncbi:MAG: Transposase [Verrucomicrobiales bacterium]|nr:Transposase [Verrucomicrobiales bacterium]